MNGKGGTCEGTSFSFSFLSRRSDKMSVNGIGIEIAYKQMNVIKTKGRFHLLN